MRLKIYQADHNDIIGGRTFPYDGIIVAENSNYIYVITKLFRIKCTGNIYNKIGYIYDKTGGFWTKGSFDAKVCKKIHNWAKNNHVQNPFFVKTLNTHNIDKIMKQCNRRKKKDSGGRFYENPYQQTNDLRYRGYTDESHWTGIVGSRVAHYARYTD